MPGIQDAYNYFVGQGWSPQASAGISAGLFAESGLNPGAVNPSSGAFGIGQWLGSRQSSLFSQYGSSPSFEQQLSFVNQELGRGNGGTTIASASTPGDALSAFINLFERPGPGTAGDISRGTAALGTIDMSGGLSQQPASTSLWDQATSTIQQWEGYIMNGPAGNASTGQAAGQSGGAAQQKTGGLFGPLIDWFNGLVKGIESGVQNTLTRGAFVIVGLILLAAGIWYVAGRGGNTVVASA